MGMDGVLGLGVLAFGGKVLGSLSIYRREIGSLLISFLIFLPPLSFDAVLDFKVGEVILALPSDFKHSFLCS
jgi:hypothetical protein